jgi:hypothetical protein
MCCEFSSNSVRGNNWIRVPYMESHLTDISLLKCENRAISFRNTTLQFWLCSLEMSVKWNLVRNLSKLRAKYLSPSTVKPMSHQDIKITKLSIWRIKWKPFLQSRTVTICTTSFSVPNLYLLPTECRPLYLFRVIQRTDNDNFPEQNNPTSFWWRVLRLRMEKTAFRYGEHLRIYCTSRGQPTRGGPPTGRLSVGLTTHRKKIISLRNVTKVLELGRILSINNFS